MPTILRNPLDRSFLLCLLAWVLALLAAIPAGAEIALTQGSMVYRWQESGETGPEGGTGLELPLRKTRVTGEVSGFVARVTVQQFFSNSTNRRIEAIYKFPLPANAAVHESTIRIGDRLVVAEIHERERARKKYEKAKSKGKRASLLEQERPNFFTQSVANIGPGEEIVVAIRYVQELPYDDGAYTFSFPMTVGPRYVPGSATSHQGTGTSPDTDRVPDASRVTPPILPPALRSGHEIELSVKVDAGFSIREIASPSHDIYLDWESASVTSATLTAGDRIPNKDFVLTYSTLGKHVETTLLTHRHGEEGYFLMMVQPPSDFGSEEAVPKELVFVVDCSGSMSGAPIAAARRLMEKFIAGMNPNDTFQVIRFSETASSLSPRPLANTAADRQLGLDYIANLSGGGGTRMIEGIKAALDFPADSTRQRMVFFLTDGYIGNETEILAAIRERVGDTRLFSLGVGSSPNRYLIDQMAREGHGFSQYVRLKDDPEPVVDRFYRRINLPVMTAVDIDWGGLEVVDPLPTTIPDLFDRQPVFLVGRYSEPGTGTVILRGRQGERWVDLPLEVELPAEEQRNASLRLLWARRKIGGLMRLQLRGEIPEVRAQVLSLALEHHLMSRYTSFVAVERKLQEGLDLPLDTVIIPSELPEGVTYEGNFGPPQLSHTRVKPGDPVLKVRAPREARAVMAFFPFGLEKSLERDRETGLWSCRFLIPRDQPEGRYEIDIWIMLPEGDWMRTKAEYAVDSTAPRFDVTTRLVGRTLHFRAVPAGGVFEPALASQTGSRAEAFVVPDVLSVVVRPPHGGYVKLRVADDHETRRAMVWIGSYELPDWYRPGRYTFRFQSVDEARNAFTQPIEIRVPAGEATEGSLEASR